VGDSSNQKDVSIKDDQGRSSFFYFSINGHGIELPQVGYIEAANNHGFDQQNKG
jgi:hypothetical protein